jgi:endonuclease YncB( thermonuclease family)
MWLPIHYKSERLKLGDEPRFVGATDGDTPTIRVPIRMLGMDAPELHYAGATESNPGKFDREMERFATAKGKGLDPGLLKYLAPRLKAQPSTRHIAAGTAAKDHFEAIVAARLARGKNKKTGKALTPRHLFTMVSEQVFDRYGRLLAYVAPSYTKEERKKIPEARRPTFNLQMMQDGHAISLLIHPNVPKPADLERVREAVRSARQHKRGFWASATPLLHAYEYRWIADVIRGKRPGPDRYCGDFTTGELHRPQAYYHVPEENRLWFFDEHLAAALAMGFRLV